MQSLRTRRPSGASDGRSKQNGQSKRAGVSSPTSSGSGSGRLIRAPTSAKGRIPGTGRSSSTRKSRVDDKIRKRMSMRYAEISISAPTGMDVVPPVPSVPIGALGGVGGTLGSGERRGDGYEYGSEEVVRARAGPSADADLGELEKVDFDPDAFLRAKMASSTEAELTALQSELRSWREDTNVALQKNVFKNYAEFMMTSKEISTLENDMLELKESLAEWKSMPSLLHIDESVSVADRRRTQRSSVADLRVLYASQLQTLHSQIEGASKFVPATPGRHVVAETDGILSLNPATYRVEHSVRFILLDDAVLVARKRARRTADRPALVAQKCWPLNDILVLDTKDTATMTNVFKVRNNKETHVYRCELNADKKALLSQFRQVAEELAQKRRKEREGEHERRKTMWLGGAGDRRSHVFDLDAAAAEWMNELGLKDGFGGAKDKADKDALWVGEFTDSLTIAIALREWNKAVSLVEEGEAKLPTTPSLESKLNVLRTSLVSSLLHALSDDKNRKTVVVRLTGLLLRLHAGPAARNAFLESRATLARKRIRTIRFEGHVPMYISDLSTVVFSGIKHTADWFFASFKENDAASGLIEWAELQIRMYAEMFRKQVFSSDVDEETVHECLETSHSLNKKLLHDVGLDFRFLLDDLLVPNPRDGITSVPATLILESSPTDGVPPLIPRTIRAEPRSPATPAPPVGPLPPRSRDRPPSILQQQQQQGGSPARDGRF